MDLKKSQKNSITKPVKYLLKWFLNKTRKIILFLSVPVKERANFLPDDFFKHQNIPLKKKCHRGAELRPLQWEERNMAMPLRDKDLRQKMLNPSTHSPLINCAENLSSPRGTAENSFEVITTTDPQELHTTLSLAQCVLKCSRLLQIIPLVFMNFKTHPFIIVKRVNSFVRCSGVCMCSALFMCMCVHMD